MIRAFPMWIGLDRGPNDVLHRLRRAVFGNPPLTVYQVRMMRVARRDSAGGCGAFIAGRMCYR